MLDQQQQHKAAVRGSQVIVGVEGGKTSMLNWQSMQIGGNRREVKDRVSLGQHISTKPTPENTKRDPATKTETKKAWGMVTGEGYVTQDMQKPKHEDSQQ